MRTASSWRNMPDEAARIHYSLKTKWDWARLTGKQAVKKADKLPNKKKCASFCRKYPLFGTHLATWLIDEGIDKLSLSFLYTF
jgi:hypothetical protein